MDIVVKNLTVIHQPKLNYNCSKLHNWTLYSKSRATKVTLNVKIFFILSWFGTVRTESVPATILIGTLCPP